ncbi:E3 ubiquitin-protein ligase At3g02290-like [Primulina eburnea]|uniref:E3 ubiquitin-protein ligase At3g02290-like n=1 Tax=Primulina eburnea TaxID=1245227 RepID=UPI003C6C49A6
MGAVCCCWRGEWENFSNPNSSVYRNCVCLHCFVQNFLLVYASVFHRGGNALPSSSQGTSSFSSTETIDDSLADMYHAPPRPLPYDVDPRYVRIQQDESASRSEKGSTHSNNEMEPLRMNGFEKESDSLSYTSKQKEFTCDEGSKQYLSKSPLKLSAVKATTGFTHIYPSSEDEDVCPTCLEEYTAENPSILTKCSHHFHLGCIYEWMERSDTCPICCKVMAFDETT